MTKKIIVSVEFLWIPSDLGGNRNPPFVGMRPTFRWQSRLKEYLECSQSAECIELRFDQETSRGNASFIVEPVGGYHGTSGDLLELLDGYRVIAVGKIVEINVRE